MAFDYALKPTKIYINQKYTQILQYLITHKKLIIKVQPKGWYIKKDYFLVFINIFSPTHETKLHIKTHNFLIDIYLVKVLNQEPTLTKDNLTQQYFIQVIILIKNMSKYHKDKQKNALYLSRTMVDP